MPLPCPRLVHMYMCECLCVWCQSQDLGLVPPLGSMPWPGSGTTLYRTAQLQQSGSGNAVPCHLVWL